jgi:DNA-binding CsgD family transcriptional regulator
MVGEVLAAPGESLCAAASGALVLDILQAQFAAFSTTHFLVSGLPFPARPVEPLLLRLDWGDLRGERRATIKASDPLLQFALPARRLRFWLEEADPPIGGESVLLSHLGQPGRRRLALVPICTFLPYQAVVIAGGDALEMDTPTRVAAEDWCLSAFRRMFKLGYIRPERPGELSGREREVVELSAGGKTAGEIAGILNISQRTVHAHLQNASDKLRALNKTHTVVEALRYGQISV